MHDLTSVTPSRRRRRRDALLLFALSALAMLAAVLLPGPTTPKPRVGDAATGAGPTAATRAADSAAAPGAPASPIAGRREVTAPALTFADYVARLVELGLRTAERAGADDHTAARASDDEARALFATMFERLGDADEPALAMLTDRPDAPGDDAGQVRERVLLLTLETGLQRRQPAAGHGGRERLDAQVAALLAVLPQHDRLPELLGRTLLVGKPYLGAAHETAVTDLLELAGQGRFPLGIAGELLDTLWRNLAAHGDAASAAVTSLALLFVDDANPARRLGACRQLLRSERFRDVVLARVRERRDATLAGELAAAAATELPPLQALGVLAELGPLSPAPLVGPYLTVAQREPAALQRAYEQRLADDVRPDVRAELVTGAGFARCPEGLEVAKLAIANDPAPAVRVRAMFALTGAAPDALGEGAIERLLDDATCGAAPDCLGACVLALENLERAGLVNAVDRLGQRLRLCSNLRPMDRDNLERILARALPGGRTTR